MRRAACLAFAAALSAAPALAEIPDHTIKVGVLNDGSGPFADQSGKGSVVAAQLAAEDFMREARSCTATTRTSPTSAAPSCGNGSTATVSRR